MRKFLFIFIPVVLIIYMIWAAVQPMPVVQAIRDVPNSTKLVTAVPDIAWTSGGEQAVGISGAGVLTARGANSPLPIASVAKVMVALAVLQKKPLSTGQQGSNVPITAEDVQTYQDDLAQGQSVAAVEQGEQLSEYQALQGLLLPSANNLATTLTTWTFGSQSSYLQFANNYAKDLHMTNTDFTDASGFSPSTVSTASDLVLLGEVAMQNPVLAEIVGTYSATIPVAGQITNVNSNIGPGSDSDLNGIKTGNTDQAGGCLLFSSDFQGHTVVGAVVGATDLNAALTAGPQIMNSFRSALQVQTVVKAGQVIAHYNLPWGDTVQAVAQKSLSMVTTVGSEIPSSSTVVPLTKPEPSGHGVGSTVVSYNNASSSTALTLTKPVSRPGLWWRVLHPHV